MKRSTLIVLLLMISSLVGCQSLSDNDTTRQTIRVFAAASLTEVFTELKEDFEKINEGVQVELVFAGSQALATQIKEGVKCDVFASANLKYMEDLIQNKYVQKGEETLFAKNALTVIVYKEEDQIQSLKDLTHGAVKLVIADETVPVGKYTLEMLNRIPSKAYGSNYKEKVLENVVSKENNVKLVVSKVVLGEADAGIVYKTDVTKAHQSSLKIIEIPEAYNRIAVYPIARLIDSEQPKLANQWIEFLISDKGKAIFKQYGFMVE